MRRGRPRSLKRRKSATKRKSVRSAKQIGTQRMRQAARRRKGR